MQMSNFNNMYIDPTGCYLENTLAADALYSNLIQKQMVKKILTYGKFKPISFPTDTAPAL